MGGGVIPGKIEGTPFNAECASRLDEDTGTLFMDITFRERAEPGQRMSVCLSEETSHYYHVGTLSAASAELESCESLLFYILAQKAWPANVQHLEYGKNPSDIRQQRKQLKSALCEDATLSSEYRQLHERRCVFTGRRDALVHGLVKHTPGGIRVANGNVTPVIKNLPTYHEIQKSLKDAVALCDGYMHFAMRLMCFVLVQMGPVDAREVEQRVRHDARLAGITFWDDFEAAKLKKNAQHETESEMAE